MGLRESVTNNSDRFRTLTVIFSGNQSPANRLHAKGREIVPRHHLTSYQLAGLALASPQANLSVRQNVGRTTVMVPQIIESSEIEGRGDSAPSRRRQKE